MTKRATYPYRVLAIAAASGIVGCAGDAVLPREKLNVIYILADDLGSADARAWLADYYGATDSKFDAYV